jgi:hypothetical protein
MKIQVECVSNTAEEQKEFIEDAAVYGVKATYLDGKDESAPCFGCSWQLEGPDNAVKHVVEHNWQVSAGFETYDELVANEDIGVTVVGD